jgi:hypothetical protein
MADSKEKLLIVYANLLEDLNTKSLHPIDRLCLTEIKKEYEKQLSSHPLFKYILAPPIDSDFSDNKALISIRKKIFEQMQTATVERAINIENPESKFVESFENWLYDAPTGEKLSAKDLILIVSGKTFSSGFYKQIQSSIDRFYKLKQRAGEDFRSPPEFLEELELTCKYFKSDDIFDN